MGQVPQFVLNKLLEEELEKQKRINGQGSRSIS
jgi:hypothetical protein